MPTIQPIHPRPIAQPLAAVAGVPSLARLSAPPARAGRAARRAQRRELIETFTVSGLSMASVVAGAELTHLAATPESALVAGALAFAATAALRCRR